MNKMLCEKALRSAKDTAEAKHELSAVSTGLWFNIPFSLELVRCSSH